MILRSLWLLATAASFAAAYPKITAPASGSSQAGGSAITVSWSDNGESPSLSDLSSYQIFLIGGGNDASTQVTATLVTTGQFSTGSSAEGVVSASFAGSLTNAYYIKMIAVATAGGTVTVYSDRFSLTGMTGTFPTAMQTAIAGISGATDVPADTNDATSTTATTSAAAAGTGDFAMAYTLQTGLTKYAPMPKKYGTSITAKTASAQYPTSAFTKATTFLSIASQVTTTTQALTWTTTGVENTVAAASMPTDTAMARFLKRWED